MERRVKLLEEAVRRHNDQIAKLFNKVDSVNEHLSAIQKTLDQIKYMAYGGLGYFAISEMGLLNAIKLVSG